MRNRPFSLSQPNAIQMPNSNEVYYYIYFNMLRSY